MFKLAVLFFVIIAPTLAGAFVIGFLAADMATSNGSMIAVVALCGAALAVPMSLVVARQVAKVRLRAVS